MAFHHKRWWISMIATLLMVTTAPLATAQSPESQETLEVTEETDLSLEHRQSENIADGELLYPVLPEDIEIPRLEPVDPSVTSIEVGDWEPTRNPNSLIVPGAMRSDRESIPGGFTKEEADLAEIQEAKLTNSPLMRMQSDTACRVYWPSPFQVCGEIRKLYDSIGGPTSFLTFPKSNELTNPDGVGKRTEFINGFIYWHPSTGAHSVSIPATVVWAEHGWEQGIFGYPITSDVALGDQWFKQSYQGGHIITRNSVPAVQAGIYGQIYDKWMELGGQSSVLGFPISSEFVASDGVGRYNIFERGIMYWHPEYGAHAVTGDLLLQWAYSGGIEGALGYPAGDPEIQENGWYRQAFADGFLHGKQLRTFFPAWDELAGDEPGLLMSRQAANYDNGPAGGNEYTDQVVLETEDMCGNEIILRRGWYTSGATRGDGPWGYDKIHHKHGVFSLWSISTVFENSCINRIEGTQQVYEEVYQVKCDRLFLNCEQTGQSFVYRGIYERNIYKPGATEPIGLKTFFPVRNKGTHGNTDVVPTWFSTDIPTLDLW